MNIRVKSLRIIDRACDTCAIKSYLGVISVIVKLQAGFHAYLNIHLPLITHIQKITSWQELLAPEGTGAQGPPRPSTLEGALRVTIPNAGSHSALPPTLPCSLLSPFSFAIASFSPRGYRPAWCVADCKCPSVQRLRTSPPMRAR